MFSLIRIVHDNSATEGVLDTNTELNFTEKLETESGK